MSKVKEVLDNMTPAVKVAGDGTSIGVLLGTLTDNLPAVAAVMTIIWTAIRIYETKTVQRMLPCKKDEEDE